MNAVIPWQLGKGKTDRGRAMPSIPPASYGLFWESSWRLTEPKSSNGGIVADQVDMFGQWRLGRLSNFATGQKNGDRMRKGAIGQLPEEETMASSRQV